MRTAVFPGSFDPFTNGHKEIVDRAIQVFDKVIVAIGENTTKQPMFSLDERKKFIASVFTGKPVEVHSFTGLTVDFCRKMQAGFIIRGLRNTNDLEFEKSIAEMNRKMHPEIDTLFFISSAENAAVSSTIVREIYRNGGNISPFIPYRLS